MVQRSQNLVSDVCRCFNKGAFICLNCIYVTITSKALPLLYWHDCTLSNISVIGVRGSLLAKGKILVGSFNKEMLPKCTEKLCIYM